MTSKDTRPEQAAPLVDALRQDSGQSGQLPRELKEPDCLNGISAPLQVPGISLDEILRKRVELLECVLEGSRLGFWDWNIETNAVTRNGRWAESLGYDCQDKASPLEQWFAFVHPDDRKMVGQAIQDHLAGRTPMQEVEYRILTKDGQLRWVLDQARVVKRDADGQPIRMSGTQTDITERKRFDELRTFLANTGTGTVDETFFKLLSRCLAKNLGMDLACVDRLQGDGLTARRVAAWGDSRFNDNVIYTLRGTPAGAAVDKAGCCFPADVCTLFPHDRMLKDLRAESYVGATFFGRTGRPVGVIAVIGRNPLIDPSPAETMLKMVAVRAAGEMERLDVEDALRSSLAEKVTLLQEIHHRVKNNLAAIMGLLDLQGDKPSGTALAELRDRIRSMALVHQQLYQSDNYSRIDFQDYLDALIGHLHSAYDNRGDIQVGIAASGVEMGLDSAVPCGLLITELVTNAFKYAFPEGRPRSEAGTCQITISAAWDGTTYFLEVADNGVGLPAEIDWATSETMGLLLVRMLGRHQLQGQIEVDRSNGTAFRLQFAPRAEVERLGESLELEGRH